jgi:choline dehydrogenase
VVDASAFPQTPGTFLVTPTYMLSEKAFETILVDLGEQRNTANLP